MFEQVDIRNATRGLGLYTLAALVFGRRTFVFIGLIADGGWLTEVALLDLGLLVLGLTGCIGLIRDRSWGFILFYAMAIVATAFFSARPAAIHPRALAARLGRDCRQAQQPCARGRCRVAAFGKCPQRREMGIRNQAERAYARILITSVTKGVFFPLRSMACSAIHTRPRQHGTSM